MIPFDESIDAGQSGRCPAARAAAGVPTK